MAEQTQGQAGAAQRRAGKRKRSGGEGAARGGRPTIQATFNNTIVTLTDKDGATWWSWVEARGERGLQGARAKSTPFAGADRGRGWPRAKAMEGMD